MDSLQLIKQAVLFADEKKAENTVVLKVSKVVSYTDYILISEAQSTKQVQAISKNILSEMTKLNRKPIGVEGTENGLWVLIDYGDIVIHLFLNSIRSLYDIENFWLNAERIPTGLSVHNSAM